jgi:hypothetical protein
MMQLLRLLTAPFRSRRPGASTRPRQCRAVLGVEAFEERLAPAGTFLLNAHSLGEYRSIPVEQISPAPEYQINYWSWGERQVPTDQISTNPSIG